MLKKPKITGRSASMPAGLAFGTISAVLITVILSAVLSKLVDTGKISWDRIGYGIMFQTILASFVGAWIACMRIKRQRLLVCLISGCIYYGVLVLTVGVFFGGQYEGMGVTALIVLAGCASASLLGAQGAKPGKHRIKKMRYC